MKNKSNTSELIRSSKTLGVALQRYRRAEDLTQSVLAKRAGLRQATISQIENGLETVKLSTIMDLLRALDLELTLQPRTKGSHSDIEDMF